MPASSANAALLDSVLGCAAGMGSMPCANSGYNFSIAISPGTPANSYTSHANPILYNHGGARYFYSDNSAVMRFNSSTIADAGDAPVQ